MGEGKKPYYIHVDWEQGSERKIGLSKYDINDIGESGEVRRSYSTQAPAWVQAKMKMPRQAYMAIFDTQAGHRQ